MGRYLRSSDSMEKCGGPLQIEKGEGALQWRAHSICHFAVQCCRCGKYRAVPDKLEYETIRQNILQVPWMCESGIKWNTKASCDEVDEFLGSSNFILTMDHPAIPASPPGWNRKVQIRSSAGTQKFCDVYYFAPKVPSCRSVMRSLKAIERHVLKYPEILAPGTDIRKAFSFVSPTPPPECTTLNNTAGVGKSIKDKTMRGKRQKLSLSNPLNTADV